jgi:hypothetical protein
MTPIKIYAIFWFGFLLCASAVFTAMTGAFGPGGSLALLLGGVLGIWVVFVWRERASARVEKAQAQRNLARLPELERQMQSGQPVEIAGSSGIGLCLVMLIIAGLVTWWAVSQPGWQVIAAAVLMWVIALLSALSVAPLLGKPILRIAHDGVETPAYGKLLWDEVDGIDLGEVRSKGQTISYRLHLLVPNLAERREQMHPATRLQRRLFLFLMPRAELRLRLSRTSESPQFILTLCQRAWTRCTGKKAVWSTLVSAEMLADLRDGERQLSELERAGALAETDPAAATAILDRLEKERRTPADPRTARALAKDEAEMKELIARHGAVEALRIHGQRMDERRRQVQESALAARRTHWLTWVVAAIVVLYLIVQIAWWIVSAKTTP